MNKSRFLLLYIVILISCKTNVLQYENTRQIEDTLINNGSTSNKYSRDCEIEIKDTLLSLDSYVKYKVDDSLLIVNISFKGKDTSLIYYKPCEVSQSLIPKFYKSTGKCFFLTRGFSNTFRELYKIEILDDNLILKKYETSIASSNDFFAYYNEGNIVLEDRNSNEVLNYSIDDFDFDIAEVYKDSVVFIRNEIEDRTILLSYFK